MASIKISELNSLDKAEKEDILVIVDSSENETKKIAIEDLNIGSTDVVISEEQPEGEDWKIWIDSDEVGNLGSEVEIGLEGNGRKLWVEVSKNLININRDAKSYTAGLALNENNYYLNMTGDGGVGSGVIVSNVSTNGITVNARYVQGVGIPIKCKPNTKYSIQCKKTDVSARLGYSFYTASSTFISGSTSSSADNQTITSPSNAEWMVLLCVVSGSTVAEKTFSNIMVNEGELLSYEPYITPNIKANINGNYETIARKNVYLEGEVVIGEWFGKPLYRKVINIGVLPNNTTKNIDHNISNIDTIVKLSGIAQTVGKNTLLIPSYNGTNYVNIYSTTTNIQISTNSDRSSFNGYAILEYTKTTDTASTASLLSEVEDNEV